MKLNSSFQVVLAQFKSEDVQTENLWMNIYGFVVIFAQMAEITSYLVIYLHLRDHNNEMLQSSTISSDVYQVSKHLLKYV